MLNNTVKYLLCFFFFASPICLTAQCKWAEDPLGKPAIWKQLKDKPTNNKLLWELYMGKSFTNMLPADLQKIDEWKNELMIRKIQGDNSINDSHCERILDAHFYITDDEFENLLQQMEEDENRYCKNCLEITMDSTNLVTDTVTTMEAWVEDPLGKPEIWQQLQDNPANMLLWEVYAGKPCKSMNTPELEELTKWKQGLMLRDLAEEDCVEGCKICGNTDVFIDDVAFEELMRQIEEAEAAGHKKVQIEEAFVVPNTIQLYPTINQGVFKMAFSANVGIKQLNFVIHDVLGRKVSFYVTPQSNQEMLVTLTTPSSGIYYLTVSGENFSKAEKFVIENE